MVATSWRKSQLSRSRFCRRTGLGLSILLFSFLSSLPFWAGPAFVPKKEKSPSSIHRCANWAIWWSNKLSFVFILLYNKWCYPSISTWASRILWTWTSYSCCCSLPWELRNRLEIQNGKPRQNIWIFRPLSIGRGHI